MSTIEPLPGGGATREEIAKREIGHTTIAPGTARALVACFMAGISVMPLVEWSVVRDVLRIDASRPVQVPEEGGSIWRKITAVNRDVLARMNGFERGLEEQSRLGRLLRPPIQIAMTRWLGAGNERVYPGRAGWLFYRPDVEYLTGPGFLSASQIERRIQAVPEWMAPPQPDPREAIVAFARDLEPRGIALIVMPTPLKPVVHPEMLAPRFSDAARAPQNPSYRSFVVDLEANGVLVFDPSDALVNARRADAQYLATDSHWRPESMEAVADSLAAFITARVRLPAKADPGYRVERVEVRNRGDIERMLDVPDGDSPFPPEAVWLRRILQADRQPWRSSRDADVLVLGDSFSNIYTLESMGWGTSAGLVEQLSYALGRPIDRLAQNDEGAFATRAMLQRDPRRLDGKRVVVYQFAMRELAFGDWKVLRLD